MLLPRGRVIVVGCRSETIDIVADVEGIDCARCRVGQAQFQNRGRVAARIRPQGSSPFTILRRGEIVIEVDALDALDGRAGVIVRRCRLSQRGGDQGGFRDEARP